MSRHSLYDEIGQGYQLRRQQDPRIAAALHAALGTADSVINIGAGTGSYEPRDRRVIAVEPSETMLSQRPATAAPAVRGVAETLPFRDGQFGAAMAVLTLHHWRDKARGLAEMRRVSRGPVIIFGGCDGVRNTGWWLHDYFPAARELVGGRNYSIPFIESVLGPVLAVKVPIAADCLDGFEAAWWQRPHAILDPVVWRATSALSMIGEAGRSAGLARLEADLADGTWEREYGYLLAEKELDLGYRVVIAGV